MSNVSSVRGLIRICLALHLGHEGTLTSLAKAVGYARYSGIHRPLQQARHLNLVENYGLMHSLNNKSGRPAYAVRNTPLGSALAEAAVSSGVTLPVPSTLQFS